MLGEAIAEIPHGPRIVLEFSIRDKNNKFITATTISLKEKIAFNLMNEEAKCAEVNSVYVEDMPEGDVYYISCTLKEK